MALITFEDKVSLNPQPSVADKNKVKDSDMNMIKNAVNNSTTYSTTEKVVGEFMGNPLYRKVITGTFTSATESIANIITGYDKVINYSGTIKTPSGYITQIPEYTSATNYCYFVLNTANNYATLTIPSSFVGGTYILIVEYTKS